MNTYFDPSEQSNLGGYQTFPNRATTNKKKKRSSLKITTYMLQAVISIAICSQKKKARVEKYIHIYIYIYPDVQHRQGFDLIMLNKCRPFFEGGKHAKGVH